METTRIKSPPSTMMEVFKSLPEGTLVQLIENSLVMTPAPLFRHQEIQSKIIESLFIFLHRKQLGKLLVAPLDVFLDEKNAFQPDIIFLSNDNKEIIQDDGLHGAPDLIIEILSPSTAKYDLNQKKDAYERSGVREYWVVDPEDKMVKGYFLDKGSYGDPLTGKGLIRSRILDHEIQF